MFWRFLFFIVCELVGGLLGAFLVLPELYMTGALLGTILGSLWWLLLDMSRVARLLKWLRVGDTLDVAMHTGLWGELSDRTRRLIRAKEQMTRDSQSRLQDFLAAFQASPNGVVLLDVQGRIEWFNQMAALHYGLDVQRDLLQHFGNLVRDPGYANYFASQDFSTELQMPGRQSTPAMPVTLSVQLHTYGVGRLLLLSRDVTAVEQAEAMRRDFVANVSHEIRTPLTVLGGFVETLQTLRLSAQEQERYLDLMAVQADRMQSLVSDLLMLSRLEGSPPPGTQEWVALPSLMEQLKQDAHALSAALNPLSVHGHRIIFSAPLNKEIAGSPSELHSALSNLVSNAIRYTPPTGEVQLKICGFADGRVACSVTDTGPGIASEHISRLTERFYRVDRSRSRDTGGTGLGLAIVKHVAQRHGAELKIESTLGKGSSFTIVFPASRIRPMKGSFQTVG
jgi:two-component system phosphate regulon sensor histidine kinase PhoR